VHTNTPWPEKGTDSIFLHLFLSKIIKISPCLSKLQLVGTHILHWLISELWSTRSAKLKILYWFYWWISLAYRINTDFEETWFTCRGQILWKSAVGKLTKYHLVLMTKSWLRGTRLSPLFYFHWAYHTQNFLNFAARDLCISAQFCPDWLGFTQKINIKPHSSYNISITILAFIVQTFETVAI